MSCVVFVVDFDQNLFAGYVLNQIKIIFASLDGYFQFNQLLQLGVC